MGLNGTNSEIGIEIEILLKFYINKLIIAQSIRNFTVAAKRNKYVNIHPDSLSGGLCV